MSDFSQKLTEDFNISFLSTLFINAPPPNAITTSFFLRTCNVTFSSKSLKYCSPLSLNIFFIDFCSFFSISLSTSINLIFNFFANNLPIVTFQHPSFQLKQGFFSKILPIKNLIYHKFVLFFEFKYIF